MRGTRWLVLMTTLGVGAIVAPVAAHHSLGVYDQATLIPLKGTVTGIEWRNPHSWITLSAQNANGRIITQRIEIAGPNALLRKGVTQTLLNIGDAVTLEVWMPKDPRSDTPNGRWITLADGRRFDIGDDWLNNLTRPDQQK